MKRDITISNEVKFGLYARLYNSMGLDVTFINGFFGQKNILRVFSVDDLFRYYDNEIYEASLGRKGNTFWILFKYKKMVRLFLRLMWKNWELRKFIVHGYVLMNEIKQII